MALYSWIGNAQIAEDLNISERYVALLQSLLEWESVKPMPYDPNALRSQYTFTTVGAISDEFVCNGSLECDAEDPGFYSKLEVALSSRTPFEDEADLEYWNRDTLIVYKNWED